MSSPFYSFPNDNPAVPFTSGQVSVTSTATLIGTFEGNQSGVLLYNGTGATVYLGGSAVTTSTGYPLATSTSVVVPTNGGVNCQLYGITSSTSSTVSYLHPTNGGPANNNL